MSNEIAQPLKAEPTMVTEERKLLKPYCKPDLQELGNLRTLTLGGSGGNSVDSDSTITNGTLPIWYP